MVYGDFEICSVEIVARPIRRRRWLGLGEWGSSPGEARIWLWPRLISGTFALILVTGVAGGIRRNGGVAA
jgi:hypothetical protein